MTASRCAPRRTDPVRKRNPFPVFPGEVPVSGPIRKSRAGGRRAIVLAMVHVLILAHVAHWIVTGRTIGPVEPSEAMETLELGRVNPGFVFFALAILSTAVFGRFVCGWGCHLVALQDLCAWAMRRIGVRPRPFRSRLLAFVPLGLALYMFAWPTCKRLVLLPLLEPRWPGAAALLLPPAPFPGFTASFTTEHFWESFPTFWIAVPFLLVCGFVMVYLMGAKGFCTYGCPYGAVFGAVDTVAPVRIRVSDACNQCGHCTATCTSNVRVHEEVREFGMVVDPGCMKCGDCVSVCPNDALRFGFGRPALAKGPPRTGTRHRRFDLGWRWEFGLATVFLAVLVCHRGVYDAVPLLMAVGVAATTAFLLWTALRILRERDVSLQGSALRRAGRMRPAGAAALTAAAALLLLAVQSGAVQWHRARGEAWDRMVSVSREGALAPDRDPVPRAVLAAARRAERHYRASDSLSRGGLGLLPTTDVAMRRAWLAVVDSRFHDALDHLGRVARQDPDSPELQQEIERVRSLVIPTHRK